jgi:uncharacterized protein YecE (DUF72 family)
MNLWVGTSGYSYKEWKGSFYPAALPAGDMLRYYAERLNSVEINNTFYRMPTAKVLSDWASQVPERFSFVLKASRRITHQKKLRDAADEVDYLARTASELGAHLGPVLFQLPPYLKQDLPLLRDFLAVLPDGLRAAFEFRSSSWFVDETYDALSEAGVALVAADAGDEKLPPVVRATASYGYARLRQPAYGAEDLDEWIERLSLSEWTDAYVFFKHEEAGAGPRMAKEFVERAGTRSAGSG